MSTSIKRSLAQAQADAEAFRRMFPPQAYERWEIAGSVRREKPEVGDIEHVVIPRFGEVDAGAGLFADPVRVNLLWHHLYELVGSGKVTKHLYMNSTTGAVSPRWGELYRGVDFNGFNHEIFLTTPEMWGSTLLIRTGPAEYSKYVVTAVKDNGIYRQQDGGLIDVVSGARIPTPTEEEYCRLCGVPWINPRAR